jgi:hypothetical protein
VRHHDDRLAQERDGLIGAARTAGVPFAQKNCPEPVRNIEVGIERRSQIQERVQQPVFFRRSRSRQPVAAVMLNRTDPVHISRERIEAERQALERRPRSHVEHSLLLLVIAGVRAIALHLQRNRRRHGSTCREHHEELRASHLHLKSLRAKITEATSSSAAM